MRLSNNRSVMPLDVRGRTRATMKAATCVRTPPERVGEPAEPPSCQGSGLVNLPVNEEFWVSASHQLALIKSLPFVHTARRYYQSEALVRPSDCSPARHGTAPARRAVTGRREESQTWLSIGSKSHNKVSVGEPAEGSLMHARHACTHARMHARTCTMPPARGRGGAARRAATRPPPGATLAGGRYLLVAPAPPARAWGSKSCALRPPRPPAPTYLFGIRRPCLRRGGSLTSNRTGPLRPGGLCPAQASAASFHFGVWSFADDSSLSGGILVGSAVPSLQSPENHPPLWHLPCSRAGPQPGGAQGRGVLGWGLSVGPSPTRAAYLFWCTLCVTDVDGLMWITWWCCPEVVIIATKHS